MPTFLLTLTMVLGMVGGVLAPKATAWPVQVAPSRIADRGDQRWRGATDR